VPKSALFHFNCTSHHVKMGNEQSVLAHFYDIENVVSIDIEMPESAWKKVATAEPKFGWRHSTRPEVLKATDGHRYEWSPTTSVSISGTFYPNKQTFKGVGIVKKSFGGSKDDKKPSLKLEFGRKFKGMTKAEKEAAAATEELVTIILGTSRLILNNSVQDKSLIRQPVGYKIFRDGGIPAAWCNFAKVTVTDPAQGNKKLLQEVYINVEPVRKPYLRRNFNNDKGNLYETEAWFDLTKENFTTRGFDSSGFSKFENQEDIRVAIEQLDKGLDAARKTFDIDQITKVLAMSAMIQDRDGYANNTFFYNDVEAVESPTVGNGIKFRMIPSGIDAILAHESSSMFKVKVWTPAKYGGRSSRLAQMIVDDATGRANLKKACDAVLETYNANLNNYIAYAEKAIESLKKAGLDPTASPLKEDVDKVIRVLRAVPRGMKVVSIPSVL